MEFCAEKSGIQQAFNKSALTYDLFCDVQMQSALALINLIKKHHTFNNVLDIGCGTGITTLQLQRKIKYKKFFAIDFSEKLLALARQRLLKNSTCILADFDQMPFIDGTINLIFSNMSLQWSFNYQKTFSEINRILAHGGWLVLAMPNDHCFVEIKEAARQIRHCELFNNFLSESAIRHYLHDFEIVSSKRFSYTKYFKNTLALFNSFKQTGTMFVKHHKANKLSKNFIKDLDNYFLCHQWQDNIPLKYDISLFFVRK